MDQSPSAGRLDPPSPAPEPPVSSGSASPPQAPLPRRSSGKRPLATFAVAGVMIGLAVGALGLLVRGAWRGGVPHRAAAAAADAQNPPGDNSEAAEGAEAAGSAAGSGANDEDADLVPDVDPALFRNSLDAASGGTKPVWQDGSRATLVDFWASWCGPCLQELPHLQELQERVEARGMRVVLVNVDLGDAKSTGRFLGRRGVRLDSLVDRDAILFQAIGLEALPSTFVLDAKGRPVEFFEGGASREDLETALLRANEKRVRESYR